MKGKYKVCLALVLFLSLVFGNMAVANAESSSFIYPVQLGETYTFPAHFTTSLGGTIDVSATIEVFPNNYYLRRASCSIIDVVPPPGYTVESIYYVFVYPIGNSVTALGNIVLSKDGESITTGWTQNFSIIMGSDGLPNGNITVTQTISPYFLPWG